MLVEAENIRVTIRGNTILRGESVSCPPGTMTALTGPSGSGKTTLLHCLGLLLTADQGRVLVDGRDVTACSSRSRRRFWRDHAAFVLQDYGIMDEESVAFNVTMRSGPFGLGRAAGAQALDRVLEQTGLGGRQMEPASHLSGGEKQRLALARAMYKKADVLFVDEPTASLDAPNRSRVVDLFTGFAKAGCTVIISTHDSELIEACGARHRVGARSSSVEETFHNAESGQS